MMIQVGQLTATMSNQSQSTISYLFIVNQFNVVLLQSNILAGNLSHSKQVNVYD